jgi:AcrR family transcriptional regulator
MYYNSITITFTIITFMSFALFSFAPHIKKDTYLKDPFSSELGQTIIRESITLINELGFEEFTFKKLALKIASTEATIYRYFDNKHKLLLYLTSWYWCWIEYQLALKNTNIASSKDRLKNAIKIIANSDSLDTEILNIKNLFNIICLESSKSYMIKNVDDLNKSGLFFNYKKIVAHISEIVMEINPNYKYPHMLVSTVIEGIHHQKYFADHLPALTDRNDSEDFIYEFYSQMTISSITK